MMRFLVVAAFLLLPSVPAVAQVATGTYAFGAFDNHGFDSVNAGNLNVHFGVPIINKSGRGLPFYYNLSYDSSVWYPVTANGAKTWNAVQNFGWRGDTEVSTGYLSYSSGTATTPRAYGGPTCVSTMNSGYFYHDTSGVAHAFAGYATSVQTLSGTGCPSSYPNFTSVASDGSGYTLTVTNLYTVVLTSATGKTISPPVSSSGSGTVTDANGNQVSTDGNGNFTDTTGKVVLQVSGGAPNPQLFTYTDTTGTSRAVTVTYKPQTVQTNFGCGGVGEYGPTSTSLVDTISLADDQPNNPDAYHFTYETTPGYPNSVTGRLASVTLPGGGVIGYKYTGSNGGIVCADGSAAGLVRTMLKDSPNTSWTYSRTPGTGTSHTDVVDGLSNHLSYDFVTATVPSGAQQLGAYFYETNRKVWNGAASGSPALARDTCYNNATDPCTTTALALPVAQLDTYETLDGQSEHGGTAYYNANGLQTQQNTYDFHAPGARGNLLRSDYWNYPSSGIANLISSAASFDAGSNQLSGTNYAYDETTGTGHAALATTSNLPQHVAVGTAPRGNLTTVSQWHWTGNAARTVSSLAYDDAGQVVSTMDGRNNTITFTYDSSDTFPVKTTYPTPNSNVGIATNTQYDAMTGVLLSSTDPNGQTTTYPAQKYDALLRSTEVDYPDGGQTLYAYTPTEAKVSRLRQGSNYIVSMADTDGYGRQAVVTLKDPNDGDTFVNYTYDGNGNAASVTNPHRSGGSTTDGTTYYTYDGLGRSTIQTQPGPSTKTSVYYGNTVISTDEAGNQWKRTVDGAGRLTQVLEPGTASKAPSIETDYAYGGLTTTATQQGAGGETPRVRSFFDDGNGSQRMAMTPEAGTICYGTWSGGSVGSGTCLSGYDGNGNLLAKTDNRNVTVNYQYDSLNRMTLKSGGGIYYSYVYDLANWAGTTSNYPVGRLVGASNNVNAAEAFSYDPMGRIAREGIYTPGSQDYTSQTIAATYDAAGNLATLTYPDGRVVTQGWNNAGHQNLSALTWAGGQSFKYNYLTAATYLPTGTPATMTFGNGAIQTFSGNGRLQTSEISVRMNANGNNQLLLDKQLCYGPSVGSCPTLGSGKDNGDIWAMVDLLKSNATQTFGYDNLNRLTGFGTNDQSASQTYSYDSFGNMNQVAPGTSQSNLSFNANNQIASTGFLYDAAGNLTQANVGAGVYQTMAYNAENKLTNYNNGAATYTYDAMGTRVRKDVGSNWTEYISFNGQTLAERNSNGTWSDYIYAAGQKIALSATYDARLHTHGTCAANCILTWQLPVAGGYTIKSGDKLMWRQYQAGGGQGGMDVQVKDPNGNALQAAWNLQDTAGQYINYMTAQNQWVNRTVDLSSFANDVVSVYLLFVNNTTPAGSNFDIYHSNIAIVSTDGTVTTLYAGQPGTSIPNTYNYGNNGSNLSGVQETVNAGPTFPDGTTMYYHGDHLGSARMMTWAGGWPVASDTFHPFGLEPAGASDTNHYRYASLERDSESGLDHADFRQLASSQGRWTSPDPYDGSYDAGNPQSLNRYAYVLNNPMSYIDPLGLDGKILNTVDIGNGCFILTIKFDGPSGDNENPAPGQQPTQITVCSTAYVPRPASPVVPPGNPGNTGGTGNAPSKGPRTCGTIANNVATTQNDIKANGKAQALINFASRVWPTGSYNPFAAFSTIGLNDQSGWDYKSGPTDQAGANFGNVNYGANCGQFFGKYGCGSAGGAATVIPKPHSLGGPGIPFVKYPYGDQSIDAPNVMGGVDIANGAACKGW